MKHPQATTTISGITPAPAAVDQERVHITAHLAADAAALAAATRAAEAAIGRFRFLAAASERLAQSLDYEETLVQVARLAVPTYADWCAVDLVDENGEIRQLALEHEDPRRVTFARRLNEHFPPAADGPHGAARVIRTGVTDVVPDMDAARLASIAQDAEHFELLRALAPCSLVTVPMRAGARVIGALTFVQADSARRFTPDDVTMLEDLGRRAGVAIHNARLVTQLSAAHAQLEQQSRELETQTVELEETMAELEQRNEELQLLADEATQARVTAERANEAKSQFLAGMSHELRTPLNAIAGYSELLELGIPGQINGEQREIIARIQRNQRRLLGLINDILNFTRLTTTYIEFPVQPVALAPLVRGLEQLIGPQIGRKRLQLLPEPVAADLRALANAERLEQILLNLLSNAMKFTAPGGTIRIRCQRSGERVRIEVEDSGRGIPPSEQVTIFEPFVQVDPEPARENAGVGLGLAISRELARAMNGEIEVESEPGQGSRFTVCLPLA